MKSGTLAMAEFRDFGHRNYDRRSAALAKSLFQSGPPLAHLEVSFTTRFESVWRLATIDGLRQVRAGTEDPIDGRPKDVDFYLLAKALHMISFMSWFAGLFYLPRLFIYHAHANERPDAERRAIQAQLEVMQDRLWRIITRPAMVATFCFGLWLAHLRFGTTFPTWFLIKLVLLAGLFAYHHVCGRILRAQRARTSQWKANQLRMFNELATLFAVSIIFLAVFKTGLSALWAGVGIVCLGVTLMVAIRLYRRALLRAAAKPS
jgi:putative membrane protein